MIIRELNPREKENPEKINFTWNPEDMFKIRLEKIPQKSGQKFFSDNLDILAQDAEKKSVLAKIGLGNSEFRLKGESLQAGYLYDFQLQSQNPQVVSKLWAAMSVHAEESNLSFLFGYFPRNRENSFRFDFGVKGKLAGKKILYMLPSHKRLASSQKIGHFTPKKQKTKKEHTVNQAQSGNIDLFPASPTSSFLDNYLGEVQGPSHAAKIWDPNCDFSFSLDYTADFSQTFSFILNKALPLFKRPRAGKPIKGWFVYELDGVEEKELLGLLEGIRRQARKRGIGFIAPCFDSQQKVPSIVEENAWGKSIYDIYFFPLTKIKPPENQTYFHPIFL